MEERRNCVEVIDKILALVPEGEMEFIIDLKWNREDASYKAPEEVLQWQRTAETLRKHIPMPKLDWHFEILSLFIKKPIEEIKEMAKAANS